MTTPLALPLAGARSTRSMRPMVTLGMATVGFALNLRAWLLLGPHLEERFHVGMAKYTLVMALPLTVGAVARLPVGVLTDRYGAQVMFPLVSLTAAVSVFWLGYTESLPAIIVAGGAAGLGGAAFVVGASLVTRTFRYGRRGLALGVFGLGTAGGVLVAAALRSFDPAGRRATLVLAGLLVGYAGVAALVFRDNVAVHRSRSPLRIWAEVTRLAWTTPLSLLYALALGGVVAIATYLPAYLTAAYRIRWFQAVAITGVVVVVAAVARLVGGWWTDRRPTTRLLVGCYTVAAGLCLVAALEPPLWPLTAPVIAGIAICDGVANGALLALIGKAARPESVGAVLGAAGAAGALGGLVPVLLLAGVDHLSHSYSTAWTLLGAMLLAAAIYVRANGLRVGLGLPLQFEPEPSATAMTVAVVGESETRLGAAAVVACLAELATTDELIVVYGTDERGRRQLSAQALVAGVHDRLPRHSVVAVLVAPRTRVIEGYAAMLGEFVEVGTVAIVVTANAEVREVAAELSHRLQVDRVLRVSYTPADGAELHQVWTRSADTAAG